MSRKLFNGWRRLVSECFGVVTRTADRNVAFADLRYAPFVLYERILSEEGQFEPIQIVEQQTASSCDAKRANETNKYGRRICFCSSSGPVTGDPHITKLRGDHYTLLKQGTFLAWSFRKTSFNSGIQAPVEWQLLASYSGARFTTAGLLLIDHTHSVMELTAKDCQWRGRQPGGEWHNATVGVNGEDRPSYVEVIDLNRTIKGHLHTGSVMKLKMKEEDQTNSVAKLVTHCKPGDRLDFIVRMYDQDDLDHVGGELGAPKHRAEKQVSFLSSKHMVNMKTDSEFEAGVPGCIKQNRGNHGKPKQGMCSVDRSSWYIRVRSQRRGWLWAAVKRQTLIWRPGCKLEPESPWRRKVAVKPSGFVQSTLRNQRPAFVKRFHDKTYSRISRIDERGKDKQIL